MTPSKLPTYADLAEALENLYCAAKSGQDVSLHPSVAIAKEHLAAIYDSPADVDALEEGRRTIEVGIAKLRAQLTEPVTVRYGRAVEIEIRPQSDDDRVLVYADGMGCTTVNYTDEGVILDVHAENPTEPEPVHTASIYREDLEDLEDLDAEAEADSPSP